MIVQPAAAAADHMTRSARQPILDLSRDELELAMDRMGQPAFRARQIWRALYHEARDSFDAMTNVSKALRARLHEEFTISPLTPVMHLQSRDGSTDKALFRLADGELIETVLMRYDPDGHRRQRRTVCISTQAGCALGCTFCATGQQGFVRQLSQGEIVGQVLHMIRLVRAEQAGEKTDIPPVTNVVFMGMGEPFANYDNTMAAISVLNDGQGVNIGARHMTVSTVGLAPQIVRFAEEPYQVNLAVSLHAPDDESRSRTMPVNKRYPIQALMSACRRYIELTNRRIFFEYVLLDHENDTPEHARKLARLLDGMLCHVNLIPVNATAQGPHARPNAARTEAFRSILRAAGIASTMRIEKGIDINAGCGQLRARALATAD